MHVGMHSVPCKCLIDIKNCRLTSQPSVAAWLHQPAGERDSIDYVGGRRAFFEFFLGDFS